MNIILPITLTMAGAAALLNIWIAYRVGKLRIAHNVLIGDGGQQPLTARMRAHSNYTEYTPFFLILLGLIELAVGSQTWLWFVGIAYILARILHVFGMERQGINPLRFISILVTMVTLLGLAAYAISIPYTQRVEQPETTFAAN